MNSKFKYLIILLLSIFLLFGCSVDDILDIVVNESDEPTHLEATPLEALNETENFKSHALVHILEGELNRNGQAVGFHYAQLETKKGEIIHNTETKPNENGVYEAKVRVNDVNKTSNNGKSTFFPDEWDSQDVVDAINIAYENRTHINGNTFEGLTEEGIIIRMYLDQQDKIISAFPVY